MLGCQGHEPDANKLGGGSLANLTALLRRQSRVAAGDAERPLLRRNQQRRLVLALPFAVGGLSVVSAVLIVLAELSADMASHAHGTILLALLVLFALSLASYPLVLRECARSLDEDLLDRLRDEKKVIEAENASKVRYLANVSHELRSPLNAIYGYAQLIERGAQISPQEAAGVIRRSAEHLTGLVEGLLDFSQLEAGVLRVKQDVVDPAAFLDQVVSMMRPAAIAKGLEFRFAPAANLPAFVRIDQNRLRQVLINLLSNAIKFTASGWVGLSVRYSGSVAVFEVRDSGPGIRAEDRERIFDPFELGEAQAVAERAGIGLGLPIASAIVGILGGDLELDSEPGEGSCFRIRLYMGAVPGMVPKVAQVPRMAGYEGPERRVLAVDDDPAQLSFVEGLLHSLGFAVTACTSGEAALEAAASDRFDLAILDLRMPGLSGWETAQRLRATLGPDLRVIILSANVAEFHKPETDEPVHDLFLMKPVRLSRLTEAIGGLLGLTWKVDLPADLPEPPPSGPGQTDSERGRHHIERLRELLHTGHVRAIEREISQLAEAAPDRAALVADLQAGLHRFDLAAMLRRLEAA